MIAAVTDLLIGSGAGQGKGMNFFLPFFLAIFVATSSLAQWKGDEGELVPDTEWHRSDGTFGVMLILTTKPDAFLENWEKPTDEVEISTANEIRRGETIVAVVLFTGCQPDSDNLCNLVVAHRVLKPSGEIYADTGQQELWLGKPGPPEGALQLGAGFLRITIEPDDPLGEYRIYAAVRDLNSSKQLLTLQRFATLESE